MLACVRAEFRPRLLAALLGSALLLAVVLGYLALEGRLPTRVLWLAFLPFAAFAAGLFPGLSARLLDAAGAHGFVRRAGGCAAVRMRLDAGRPRACAAA